MIDSSTTVVDFYGFDLFSTIPSLSYDNPFVLLLFIVIIMHHDTTRLMSSSFTIDNTHPTTRIVFVIALMTTTTIKDLSWIVSKECTDKVGMSKNVASYNNNSINHHRSSSLRSLLRNCRNSRTSGVS
mmetsp:Transcript_18246/g.18443  ORF Transcript_18246/g.18443 Transcript_18246/m.18443 type:complete len:128 (-) Transcript_18246:209-592(-)